VKKSTLLKLKRENNNNGREKIEKENFPETGEEKTTNVCPETCCKKETKGCASEKSQNTTCLQEDFGQNKAQAGSQKAFSENKDEVNSR
jgi:hypothetical protein